MTKGRIIGIIILALLILLLFIAAVNRNAVRMIWQSTVQQRVALDETADWQGGDSYEHIPYSDVSDADYLHLYVPEADSPMPLAIMVHGGGFILGDADSRQSQYIYRYFRDHGYAAATVNYRLADEAPYPAAIEDVKAAIRYLRANADRYGYDPSRFVIIGESAGGYLATMAAVSSDEEFMGVPFIGEDPHSPVSARVSALVDFYGIMDFALESADWRADGVPGIVVSLASNWMWGHTGKYGSWMDCWIEQKVVQTATLGEMTEAMRAYCPSAHIADDLAERDFHAVILHGDADITVSMQNSLRLYDALSESLGADRVRLTLYPGYGHAADLFFSEEHLNELKAYLDQIL